MEKMQIDILTNDSVHIKKEAYTGTWRKAYANSVSGRQELQAEVPEPYLSEILVVWGDEPTIIEEKLEELTEEEKLLLKLIPTQEQIQNAELEIKILEILQEVLQ